MPGQRYMHPKLGTVQKRGGLQHKGASMWADCTSTSGQPCTGTVQQAVDDTVAHEPWPWQQITASSTRPPRSPAPPPVDGVRAQRHATKGAGEAVQVGVCGGQELVPGVGDAHAAQLADVHASLRGGEQGLVGGGVEAPATCSSVALCWLLAALKLR